MSAMWPDSGAGRRLSSVPPLADAGSDEARPDDDGYWCSWDASALPSPDGDVVVFDIRGELDAAALPAVAASLDRALRRPAAHVVVSLTGLVFCSVRGAELFLDAGSWAAERGIRYCLNGASAQLRHLWTLLPTGGRPSRSCTDDHTLTEHVDRRGRGRDVPPRPWIPRVVQDPEGPAHP